MHKIALSLVEDQKIFRQMLTLYFNNHQRVELIGSFNDGRQCLDFLTASSRLPDIIILDLDMPVMNGKELTMKLQLQYPQIKIIVLSQHDEIDRISEMIDAGASGYLDKNCECKELEHAIFAVAKTGFYMDRLMMQSLKKNKSAKKNIEKDLIEISRRELEILEMICKQFTNAEIADKLFISVRTVDGHRNNLLAKTKSRNTAGLVLHAVRKGLITL
ncbi:response regulator transcription factor [Dyadobacter sp. CY356]|uniref:response regulator transcription factor n=1 Tax=Dyadobacter sp. CY356 TaxID=2906442 RepID=UPI001F342B8A|nr:response regulator transcription factor [Dyadobacter sp. CY356]MCF0055138.1 response regulator transcription factor [Dyadobacter sp. CY356]